MLLPPPSILSHGQSLRGILPENEILADFANCNTKRDCGSYGINSCQTIEEQCFLNNKPQCLTSGTECLCNNDFCKNNGGGNRNCKDFSNKNSCENRSCEWANGSCRIPALSFRCSDFDNGSRNKCEDEGCSWNSSTKHCSLVCRDFDNNRNMCERSGYCDWYGKSANSSSGTCEIKSCDFFDDTSEEVCEDGTDFVCYWQNSNKRCNLDNSEEEEVKEE
mmetsp:Transcript_12960/g.19447  ORF Transcript_12960/g.19447 Transcript_12960/m.19447 type:complete len:220 (+) Transcript_12960:99-758(+)